MEIKKTEIFLQSVYLISLFTVDDLEKTYDYLIKNGVKFTAPPQQTPDGFAKVTFL